MRSALLRLARVVTPNIPEAEVLSGMAIRSLDDMREAGRADPAARAARGDRQGRPSRAARRRRIC